MVIESGNSIEHISETAKTTFAALAEYKQADSREAWRQYRAAVADISGGKSIDPQTMSRILKAAGKSTDDLWADMDRAVVLAQIAASIDEAKGIEVACEPITAELLRLQSEFQAAQTAYRARVDELSWQLKGIREPLKRHDALRTQLRASESAPPDRVRQICGGWSESVRELSRERMKIQNPYGEPNGPDVTPAKLELHKLEEQRRQQRLKIVDRQISVFRRAYEIVRETMLDSETGLWDPFGDPGKCLSAAETEFAAAAQKRIDEERAASLALEQSEPSGPAAGAEGAVSQLVGAA